MISYWDRRRQALSLQADLLRGFSEEAPGWAVGGLSLERVNPLYGEALIQGNPM